MQTSFKKHYFWIIWGLNNPKRLNSNKVFWMWTMSVIRGVNCHDDCWPIWITNIIVFLPITYLSVIINGKCDINTDLTVFDQFIEFWWPSLPSSFYCIQFYHVSEPTSALSHLSHPWIHVNSVKRGGRSIHLNLWCENTFVVNKTFKLRLVNLDKF